MKKNNIKDPLASPKIRLLISFIVAVCIWSVVVTFFSTDIKIVIEDVPINIEYNASYMNLGIEVIEQNIQTVDVTVSGPRTVVGALKEDDIIVYPQFTNVRDAGTYNLALNAIKASSVMEFQIESMSNYQMSAKFDRVIEKTFDIGADVSNITVSNGYMIDKTYVTPGTIVVKGPEILMNELNKITAVVEPQEIVQSAQIPAKLIFTDVNDQEMDSTYFTLGQTEFTVTIPVLKQVELPVKVKFINVPSGFDTSKLDVEYSQKTIELGVPTKNADNLTEYIIGYVDVKKLEMDSPYMFQLILPKGYKNIKNVKEVYATVSSENMTTKKVDVKEIDILNKGQQDVEIITEVIKSVEIVGEKAVIDTISDKNVVAQLDMSQVSLAQGQQTVEVDIIIPSTNAAYAKGTYTVTIKN